MAGWLDIAHIVLYALMISYCFWNYASSKKKVFGSFGLGFVFLLLSDFLWVFAIIPWLDAVVVLYNYIRLGLFAAFALSVLYGLESLRANSKKAKEP